MTCSECDRGQKTCNRCPDDAAQVKCLVDGMIRAFDSLCPHPENHNI